MTTPTVSRWINRGLAAAILLLLFATGVATGFGFARWSAAPSVHAPGTESFRGPHYYSGLGLDPGQEQAVQAIYEKYRPQLDAILEETTPRVRAIHEQIDQEIRALLTPGQLERLETMKSRRGQGRHGRGPGSGMGSGMRSGMGSGMRSGLGPMDGYGPEDVAPANPQ
ncbi:hypothetical protein KKD52_08445 [Myxococcota bacterium]|nr:hypothetical protein [Myxococcota bacterium]MBU1410933.1 hypothetical protein [Myxococcota bacterium]MBU1510375.1 hypothetical protein [Myxococcota bacterium]